jgi:hypothetical protein
VTGHFGPHQRLRQDGHAAVHLNHPLDQFHQDELILRFKQVPLPTGDVAQKTHHAAAYQVGISSFARIPRIVISN